MATLAETMLTRSAQPAGEKEILFSISEETNDWSIVMNEQAEKVHIKKTQQHAKWVCDKGDVAFAIAFEKESPFDKPVYIADKGKNAKSNVPGVNVSIGTYKYTIIAFRNGEVRFRDPEIEIDEPPV
ncbi:MAG: hypothetical protein HYS04_04450 [Acidobacteria bacterium]|nr:hypothetical protein [Acidobacteriota bacterium]